LNAFGLEPRRRAVQDRGVAGRLQNCSRHSTIGHVPPAEHAQSLAAACCSQRLGSRRRSQQPLVHLQARRRHAQAVEGILS
jgi:hypothetical protein